MSVTRSRLRRICGVCSGPMDLVHMKTPHIDDLEVECITRSCVNYGGAEEALRAAARSAALAEEARDRDFEERQALEDESDEGVKED